VGKLDKTKKSRTVVRGYEQEPGVDFVESYSPLATNTTIKVVLATALSQATKHSDWIIEMVDVEAAFLNAKVDTDVFIEMPEGLKEYQYSMGVDLWRHCHQVETRSIWFGPESKTLDGDIFEDSYWPVVVAMQDRSLPVQVARQEGQFVGDCCCVL
jgi:hypothetical protein